MINGYSVLKGEQYIMNDGYENLDLYIHIGFIDRCLDVLRNPGQRFGYDKLASVFGFRFVFNKLGYENIKDLLDELLKAGVPFDAYTSGGRFGEAKISRHLRFNSEGNAYYVARVFTPTHVEPSMENQEHNSKLFLTRQLIGAC